MLFNHLFTKLFDIIYTTRRIISSSPIRRTLIEWDFLLLRAVSLFRGSFSGSRAEEPLLSFFLAEEIIVSCSLAEEVVLSFIKELYWVLSLD